MRFFNYREPTSAEVNNLYFFIVNYSSMQLSCCHFTKVIPIAILIFTQFLEEFTSFPQISQRTLARKLELGAGYFRQLCRQHKVILLAQGRVMDIAQKPATIFLESDP